jgi:hypothetical protein
MKCSLSRLRLPVARGILILSLALVPALPAAAERPSNAGQLLFWLLGVNITREQATSTKIDVNSATFEERTW